MWAALESQRPILFILIICVGLFHHAFYAVPLVPLRKHIKHVIGAQKHNLTFQNLSFFSKNPDVDHHLSHPNHAFASSPSPSFTSTNDEDFKDKSLIYQFLFISAVIGLIMLGGVVSGKSSSLRSSITSLLPSLPISLSFSFSNQQFLSRSDARFDGP